MGQPRQGLLSDTQKTKESLKIGMVFQSAALFDSLTVRPWICLTVLAKVW